MRLCQYEFQFQNEYMSYLENELDALLNIYSLDKQIVHIDNQIFILKKKDKNNFVLFSASSNSYVYLLIIRCDKDYENKLKKILLNLCKEIEENYGEDHKREVKDVYMQSDNWFFRFNDMYKIEKILGAL